MSAAPSWLVTALEKCESRSLDDDRDRSAVARAIVEAFPREQLLHGIGGASAVVLKKRGIRDGANDIATDIARKAMQAAELVLELPEGP